MAHLALLLLAAAHVQKKLQDEYVIFGQDFFEIVDLRVARLQDCFRDKFMNARNQNILVVRSVENTN